MCSAQGEFRQIHFFLGSFLDPNPRTSFKVEIVKANISGDDCGAKIILELIMLSFTIFAFHVYKEISNFSANIEY